MKGKRLTNGLKTRKTKKQAFVFGRNTFGLVFWALISPFAWDQSTPITYKPTVQHPPEPTIVPILYDQLKGPKVTTVEVLLNGSKEYFILDTGCGNTSITKECVERLKLNPVDRTMALGNGAGLSMPYVMVNQLKIGKVAFSNFPADVLTLANQSQNFEREGVAGLLGMNCLGEIPFQVDYRKRLFILNAVMPRPKAHMFPVFVSPFGLSVDVQVNGKLSSFIIDTGAQVSTMSYKDKQELQNLGFKTKENTTKVPFLTPYGTERKPVLFSKADYVGVGYVHKENLRITLEELTSYGRINIVGCDVLDPNVLSVDLAQKVYSLDDPLNLKSRTIGQDHPYQVFLIMYKQYVYTKLSQIWQKTVRLPIKQEDLALGKINFLIKVQKSGKIEILSVERKNVETGKLEELSRQALADLELVLAPFSERLTKEVGDSYQDTLTFSMD